MSLCRCCEEAQAHDHVAHVFFLVFRPAIWPQNHRCVAHRVVVPDTRQALSRCVVNESVVSTGTSHFVY